MRNNHLETWRLLKGNRALSGPRGRERQMKPETTKPQDNGDPRAASLLVHRPGNWPRRSLEISDGRSAIPVAARCCRTSPFWVP